MSATEQPLAGQVAVIAGSGEAFLAPALARRLTEAGAQVVVAEPASADPAAYQALAARALASRSNWIAIDDEYWPNGDVLLELKSTDAKRESSQTSGEHGGGSPLRSWGKTSLRR